jgi:hypothetical protein
MSTSSPGLAVVTGAARGGHLLNIASMSAHGLDAGTVADAAVGAPQP